MTATPHERLAAGDGEVAASAESATAGPEATDEQSAAGLAVRGDELPAVDPSAATVENAREPIQ